MQPEAEDLADPVGGQTLIRNFKYVWLVSCHIDS
jgi:hypothetical protein